MDIHTNNLLNFLAESDKIEGIYLPFLENRKIWDERLDVTTNFLKSYSITVTSLCKIVKVFEPSAELRNKEGLNVSVGGYFPPKGGKDIEIQLQELLISICGDKITYPNKELTPFKAHKIYESLHPFKAHKIYESLHPFTDGNGRSGRLLWLWQMVNQGYGWPELGFLHTWYYQSLTK